MGLFELSPTCLIHRALVGLTFPLKAERIRDDVNDWHIQSDL